MDTEAASRGTTVYLADKRVDMLPSLLGTNLCSLRSGVERLAFSVIWVSDECVRFRLLRFVWLAGVLSLGTHGKRGHSKRPVHEVCNFIKSFLRVL